MNDDNYQKLNSSAAMNSTAHSTSSKSGAGNDLNVDLDTLFSQARASEPNLLDENFTKVVVNGLPNKLKRNNANSILFDMIGLMLGVIAAYWFFDFSQLTGFALSFIPESLSITVSHVVSVFVSTLAIAFAGWWTAEKALS